MKLVRWLEQIMVSFGAGWVMWLMIGLSVISVAIILERLWFFMSLRDNLDVLARDLRVALNDSLDAAKKRMSVSPSAAAAVVMAGLETYHKGPDAVGEAIEGAKALQQMKLEKRLAYLGTLGNNAPFIGLFGTVIGVISAFKALGESVPQNAAAAAGQQGMAPQEVMAAISEALVATAVGIAIAIPAVAANNYFQRATKATLAQTESLTRVLLAHMRGDAHNDGAADVEAPRAPKAASSKKSKKKGEDD